MDISLKDVENIIDRFEKGSLKTLSLEAWGVKISLEKEGKEPKAVLPPREMEVTGKVNDGREVKSPLVGTFYAASAPGKEAYVKVGDKVSAGDTLGLIEAMKIMNEITAPCNGTVEEILAKDGEFVAFDQPIFVIKE